MLEDKENNISKASKNLAYWWETRQLSLIFKKKAKTSTHCYNNIIVWFIDNAI